MSDGRLLTLGALGALVLAAAARGSRSTAPVGRDLPIFALSHAFLDFDFDALRLRNWISMRQRERKAQGLWGHEDTLVRVTPEDWQKLQAAHRLPKKFTERQKHLDALEGRVPLQGKATLAKIREASAQQKKLADALLASLRNEIVERSRKTPKEGSQARSKGSRGVVRASRVHTDNALEKRMEEDFDALRELQGHHGKKNYRPDAYQINIKAHGAYAPDWVGRAIGMDRVYDQINEDAREELEQLLRYVQSEPEDEDERGLGMTWLDDKFEVEGRQGGYWILFDTRRTMTDLETLQSQWPGADPEDVESNGKKVGVRITDEGYKEEVLDALARADKIQKDLVILGSEVDRAKAEWATKIASDAWWQDSLDFTDDQVAKWKADKRSPQYRSLARQDEDED